MTIQNKLNHIRRNQMKKRNHMRRNQVKKRNHMRRNQVKKRNHMRKTHQMRRNQVKNRKKLYRKEQEKKNETGSQRLCINERPLRAKDKESGKDAVTQTHSSMLFIVLKEGVGMYIF